MQSGSLQTNSLFERVKEETKSHEKGELMRRMKRGINASAKNVDPRQPAQSAQANVDRNFSLSFNLAHFKKNLVTTWINQLFDHIDFIDPSLVDVLLADVYH